MAIRNIDYLLINSRVTVHVFVLQRILHQKSQIYKGKTGQHVIMPKQQSVSLVSKLSRPETLLLSNTKMGVYNAWDFSVVTAFGLLVKARVTYRTNTHKTQRTLFH